MKDMLGGNSAFFIILHWNIKMQGRAFSVTIRPSASDSIILRVSRGMWTIRTAEGKGMKERKREGKRERIDAGEECGDGWSIGWESLESFTMDCDGPGWRFIGDSRDVRRRNQVSAGLRSRLETVSTAQPALLALLFPRGRKKAKRKVPSSLVLWIFPPFFCTEHLLRWMGAKLITRS